MYKSRVSILFVWAIFPLFFLALNIRDLGLITAIELWGIFLVLCVLPAVYLVDRFFGRMPPILSIPIGSVLALVALSLGGLLGFLVSNFYVRFVPSLFLLVIAIAVKYRGKSSKSMKERTLPVPTWAMPLGIFLATLVLSGKLVVTLSAHIPNWSPAFRFNNDLPWQIAMVSEALNRVPEFMPYILGQPMSYTWGFHAALGTLGSVTNAHADQLVLQFWPALYALLIPGVIAALAFIISKNSYVAGASALIAALSAGVLIGSPTSLGFSLVMPTSPTFEFGLLVLLCIFTLLYISIEDLERWSPSKYLAFVIILVAMAFVVTAAKGSDGIILIAGSIGLYFGFAFKKKQIILTKLGMLIIALVGGFVFSYLLLLPRTGGMGLGFFTLSSGKTRTDQIAMLGTVLVLALWVIGAVILLLRRGNKNIPSVFALGAVVITGIAATVFLSHPGSSQLYFLWTAYPFLLILTFWAISAVPQTHWLLIGLSITSVFVLNNVFTNIFAFPSYQLVLLVTIIPISMVLALFINMQVSPKIVIQPVATILSLTFISTIGLQAVNFSIESASQKVESKTTGAIEQDQYELLKRLESIANSNDVVVTNRQCLDAGVEAPNCDHRYFSVSGFSGLRVLLGGWGYESMPTGSIPQSFELNQKFISKPDVESATKLWDLGVRWIYLDEYASHAPAESFSPFATKVEQTPNAGLWKLNAP